MDRNNQRRIMRELKTVHWRLLMHRMPKVPKEWDGIELRQWYIDVVVEEIKHVMNDERRERYVLTRAMANI